MNYGNGNYGYSQGNGSYGYPSYQNGVQNYSQGQQSNFESTFAWVYGDAHAEAYPVAPGKTVLLMHYNEPILYVKSVDMNGRPLPMETYDLVRRGSAQAPNGYYSQAQQQIPMQPNMSEYVKKSELEGQVNEIVNRNMGSQRMMNQTSMNGGGNGSYQQDMGAQGQNQMSRGQNWSQEVQ